MSLKRKAKLSKNKESTYPSKNELVTNKQEYQ